MAALLKRVLLVVLLAAGFVRTARAHSVGLSRGEYEVRGDRVEASLVFAAPEVEGVKADPAKTAPVSVRASEAPCPGTFSGSEPIEGDGLRVRWTFACPPDPASISIRCELLDRLPAGHEHLAEIRGDMSATAVLVQGAPEVHASRASSATHGAMIWTGVRHILGGWDHLAFLFGLVLVWGRVRSLVAAVTAFTVAHSITLALAASGVVRASPAMVEPMIALSVIYVGVENFFVHDVARRWRVTFPFGLVHGLGFAGALRELDVPRPRLPAALFSFNLGVELGQLAVLLLVAPIMLLLHRSERFKRTGVRILSACVIAVGAVFFIRALG